MSQIKSGHELGIEMAELVMSDLGLDPEIAWIKVGRPQRTSMLINAYTTRLAELYADLIESKLRLRVKTLRGWN